jgi:hypothetical protein
MLLQNQETFDEIWKILIACYKETRLVPIVTTLLKLKKHCPQNNAQAYCAQLLTLKIDLQQFPDVSAVVGELLEVIIPETHINTPITSNANELIEEILRQYLDVTNCSKKTKSILRNALEKIFQKLTLSQEASVALLSKITLWDAKITPQLASFMKKIVARLLNFIEQPEVLYENLPAILAIIGDYDTEEIIMFVGLYFVVLKLFVSCCITDL